MSDPIAIQLQPSEFWRLLALVNAKRAAESDAEIALLRLQQAKDNAAAALKAQQDALSKLAEAYGFDADAPTFRLDDQSLTIHPEGGK